MVMAAAIALAVSLLLVISTRLWPIVVVVDVLIIAMVLLDWAWTPRPNKINARRSLAPRSFVLKPEIIHLTIFNQSRFSLRFRLRDSVPSVAREPAPELKAFVPARGETSRTYELLPIRRGKYSWGPIYLRYRSVLGFWECTKVADAPGELLVYPNLSDLDKYRLLAVTDRVEAIEARPIRRIGGSAEFESLRDYTFGDDSRKLDWKATARRGRLIVRQERAERNQTVILLVDSGRLMNAEENGVAKLDRAIDAALLLAHTALSRGDRVGLCTYSYRVHAWLAPRGGAAQGRLIGETLFDLRGDFRESDPARALQLISSRHPKRSLLVTLTDFVDVTTAADLMAHLALAARRHLVLLAALKDPFLDRAVASPLRIQRDGFRQAAAIDLLRDRREVLETIRRHGGLVLDAQPDDLTPRLLNRYLEVVLRGML